MIKSSTLLVLAVFMYDFSDKERRYFRLTKDCNFVPRLTPIYPGFRSDHSLITMSIQLHNEKRGRGFWKLNVSLLLDKEYVSKIRKVITDSYSLYRSQGTAPDITWEVIKLDIRGETIKFSSVRKKTAS